MSNDTCQLQTKSTQAKERGYDLDCLIMWSDAHDLNQKQGFNSQFSMTSYSKNFITG